VNIDASLNGASILSNPNDLTMQIVGNASSPNSMAADGVTVTNNRLPEQVEADKYLAWKYAQKSPLAGLQFIGLIPGSAQR
jgi:hypothetical protein